LDIIIWLIVMAIVIGVVSMAAPYHNRMIENRPEVVVDPAPKNDAR
jgi:hypothetical protein